MRDLLKSYNNSININDTAELQNIRYQIQNTCVLNYKFTHSESIDTPVYKLLKNKEVKEFVKNKTMTYINTKK